MGQRDIARYVGCASMGRYATDPTKCVTLWGFCVEPYGDILVRVGDVREWVVFLDSPTGYESNSLGICIQSTSVPDPTNSVTHDG